MKKLLTLVGGIHPEGNCTLFNVQKSMFVIDNKVTIYLSLCSLH